MTTFDDRLKSFEAKYAHDANMQFRAEARRNKLMGLWAAALMGRTGDEAEAYAQDVIRADFQEAGDEDVIRKLTADLEGHATEDEIRAKLAEALAEAKASIVAEE